MAVPQGMASECRMQEPILHMQNSRNFYLPIPAAQTFATCSLHALVCVSSCFCGNLVADLRRNFRVTGREYPEGPALIHLEDGGGRTALRAVLAISSGGGRTT